MSNKQINVEVEELLREFFYAKDGKGKYCFDRRKNNNDEFSDMAEQITEIFFQEQKQETQQITEGVLIAAVKQAIAEANVWTALALGRVASAKTVSKFLQKRTALFQKAKERKLVVYKDDDVVNDGYFTNYMVNKYQIKVLKKVNRPKK